MLGQCCPVVGEGAATTTPAPPSLIQSLLALPEDVQAQVVSHLPAHSRAVLRSVCHATRALVSRTTSSAQVTAHKPLCRGAKALRRIFPHLSRLVLRPQEDERYAEVVHDFYISELKVGTAHRMQEVSCQGRRCLVGHVVACSQQC